MTPLITFNNLKYFVTKKTLTVAPSMLAKESKSNPLLKWWLDFNALPTTEQLCSAAQQMTGSHKKGHSLQEGTFDNLLEI